MIKWPDIKFPPVNLYSLPFQTELAIQYSDLEREYCENITEEFYQTEEGKYKEALRDLIANRRKEFNKLWNARAEG